ncbi:hypothetical protein K443DRAFT_36535, partial [Laccaria amethystina LaAM-08-1]
IFLKDPIAPLHYAPLNRYGVTHVTGPGGGKVNIQTYIGTWETFAVVKNGDSTVSFKSTVFNIFNNIFLHLNRAGISQSKILANGGGIVN